MSHKTSLSPGVVELENSTLHTTKEDIRLDQLIPADILQDRDKLRDFLEAYYAFMNMDEFIYQETESFSDVVLDNLARFRIPDPNNENNRFFTDETGADSTLVLTAPNGTTTNITLNDVNVSITNGNELPGSLAESTSEIGKTFAVLNLNGYNGYTATLTTIVKYWVGPGPSWVMNNIEKAMDIDSNETNYLELMQKEIAAAIPRDVTVNKRNLYKRIIDFYKLRGSADSIEIFFRLLFNEPVEVEFPYNETLIPSSGDWDQPAEVTSVVNGAVSSSTTVVIDTADENIRLSSKLVVDGLYTRADDIRVSGISGTTITLSDPVTLSDNQTISFIPRGTYLDNKGFLSYNIKLQDSLRYQKFSYLIKTGKNLSDWEYVYDKLVHPAGFIYFAEILIFLELVDSTLTAALNLASMPQTQPGVIGPEDIPLLVEMFASTFLPSTQAFIHKTGTLSLELKNGVISGSTITNAGSGYITYPTFDGSSSSIINVSNNTIQLTTAHQESLLVGSKVTYSSGGGTVIGGLVNNTQYYIVSSTGGKVKLSETSGGSEIDITSVGSGTSHTITKEIITTSDSGTPSGFTTAILSNTFTNGSLSSITITDGGEDYNIPVGTVAAPPRIQFDGSDDEVLGVGIVNIADDTIKLTTAQAAALPIGAKVTYDSGGDLAIGGLTTGNEYYIVYNTNDEVKLSLTSGGSVIDITSVGGGTDHGFTGETATITFTKTDGELKSVTIVEPGFGYASAPSISFSGIEQSLGSGVNPSVTIGIDSNGRLDVDDITINSTGGGWTSLFATVAANSNAGSIASISLAGLADKNYTTAPTIVFPQPTAKDALGNPLSSNVLATAVFNLDSNGEITGTSITNAGSGYVDDPLVRIGSAVQNETRVADQQEVLILSLNHEMYDPYNGFNYSNFQTIANNDSFQRKGTENFFSSARIYNTNQTIEFLGSNQIQTIDSTLINKYNTRTFVHIE